MSITKKETNPSNMTEQQGIIQSNDDVISLAPAVTFVKPLTYDEATQLRVDFDRYTEKASEDDSLPVLRFWYSEESEDNAALNDQDETIHVYENERYETTPGVNWYIIEHTETVDGIGKTTCCLKIVYNFELLFDFDNETSDVSLLQSMLDDACERSRAKDISPLLTDYSAHILANIQYDISVKRSYSQSALSEGQTCGLRRRCNIPAVYTESETFFSYNKKGKRKEEPDNILVSNVEVTSNRKDGFYIRRCFHEMYTLQQLIDEVSSATKRIIEQILSREYCYRMSANYLILSVMGGDYYTMRKATEYIPAHYDLDKLQTLSLFATLVEVAHHKSIHKVKMAYKDDNVKLMQFQGELDELIKFGINPVVIPKKYETEMLSNPIMELYRYCKQVKADEKMTCRITIEEKVGDVMLPREQYYHRYVE